MTEKGPDGLVFPVAGWPFSAQQVERRTSDSSTGELMSQICRDSAGRMRIEYRIQGSTVIHLIDPVAYFATILLVDSKVAVRMAVPRSSDGRFHIGFPADVEPLPPGKLVTKIETLEARLVEGVEVEGIRTVQTSEEQPDLTAIHETWTSGSLGVTFTIDASGPGWTHTARLRNLERGEPDPALFVIPADYTIEDPV